MDIAGAQHPEGEEVSNPSTLHSMAPDGPQTPITPVAPVPPQHVQPIIIKCISISDLAGASTPTQLDSRKKNWQSWSHSMHFILDIINAKGYVDGSISKPSLDADPDSVENWHFNDSYIKMLIAKYIAEDEMIHTTGCQTAKDMWANLKKFHQLTSYGLITDILWTLSNMRARDGNNIPKHLLKLKNQWEKIWQFKDEENCTIYNNTYFKQQIARSLPHSWDNFTALYIKAYASKKEAHLSPMKRIDSQQFIRFINQEYELQISRKQEDDLLPPKGANKNPSLASRISNPNNNNANDNSSCKRTCHHCGKIGHFKAQCCHCNKTKCSKCDRFGHDNEDCPQNQTSGSKRKGGNNNSSSSNNK